MKISTTTKNILVEITSSSSMEICKKVMEELLVEMINSGIVSTQNIVEKVEALSINSDDSKAVSDEQSERAKLEALENSASGSGGKLRHKLYMQQVKVVDTKGALKTVYPSRVDLNFAGSNKIRVVRTYDEEKQ